MSKDKKFRGKLNARSPYKEEDSVRHKYFFIEKHDEELGIITVNYTRWLLSELAHDSITSFISDDAINNVEGISIDQKISLKRCITKIMECTKWAVIIKGAAELVEDDETREEMEKKAKECTILLKKFSDQRQEILDLCTNATVRFDLESLKND